MAVHLLLLFAFGLIVLQLVIASQKNLTCPLRFVHQNNNLLDTFWINLERSWERRTLMNKMFDRFGVENHKRINAVTNHSIYFPPSFNYQGACNSLTEQEKQREIEKITEQQRKGERNMTVLIASLCSDFHDAERYYTLACTLSHLIAIHKAIHHSNHRSSPTKKDYALILEDDISFNYEIDFKKLVNSAPKNFSVMQLSVNSEYMVKRMWKQYTQNPTSNLWLPRKDPKLTWSAAAYLIHKERLRAKVAQVIEQVHPHLYVVHLLPSPGECVYDGKCCDLNMTHPSAECISYFNNYLVADLYVYNLRPQDTYVSPLPLFTPLQSAASSTIHQEHVMIHGGYKFVPEYSHAIEADPRLDPGFLNLQCRT